MSAKLFEKRVLIAIVNYNGAADTIECLESLRYLNYQNFQVMVVDNDSTDDSMTRFVERFRHGREPALPDFVAPRAATRTPQRFDPVFVSDRVLETGHAARLANDRLIFCRHHRNAGFAGGNNVALRYALNTGGFDYVWLLNNDTVVHPDALSRMVERSSGHDDRVTCGSKVMHYHSPQRIQALGGGRFNRWTGISSTSLGRDLADADDIDHRHYESRLSYISGCSWLVPLEFVRETGLMEEDYFLYCEEVDWCERSKHRFGMVYAPDSVIWHKEGASIGSPNVQSKSSLRSDYYIFRNKLRLVRRFNPKALPVAWITSLLQSLNRLRRGQKDKAMLILRVIFGIADPVR